MSFRRPSENKNKNLFAARLTSVNTGKAISWLNLTPEFSRKVFGCELKDVTYKDALETLPALIDNDYCKVEITDLQSEIEVVKATEF